MNTRISIVAMAICVANVAGVVPGSPRSFKDIQSRVGVLEERLAEADESNRQQLESMRASFESRLKESQDKTQAIASEASSVADQLKAVAKENIELRQRARSLKEDNEKWILDFKAWKGNLTTALEVTDGILSKAAVPQPELDILFKLDEEDSQRNAHVEKETRLSQINFASKTLSLLGSPGHSSDTPKEILGDLGSGLEEMKHEQAQKIAALEAHYQALLHEEGQLQSKLYSELHLVQTKLNFQVDLRSKLQSAVYKLEEQRALFRKQGQAMRVYAQKLSSKKLPEGQNDIHHSMSQANATDSQAPDRQGADSKGLLTWLHR